MYMYNHLAVVVGVQFSMYVQCIGKKDCLFVYYDDDNV